nr:hypothetical protein [uncultured Acetatifactor sp.]
MAFVRNPLQKIMIICGRSRFKGGAYSGVPKFIVEILSPSIAKKNQGYMLSFNFNKKKEPGLKEVRLGGKKLIEAVV